MAAMTSVHIDEEINKQTSVSSFDLLAKKNSCLPISRLPPETLVNIFIHAAQDYYEINHYPTFRVPHWVGVSYVCRHWRTVALNCPALWTFHFIVSLHWTEELLARSKQASLKIHLRYHWGRSGHWWADLVEKVLNHAERIQELILHVPLQTELSLYAPRLQILDIGSSTRLSPSVIKYGNIPPLRTLKLAACPLPWHSTFNLSGVTTLFLCYVSSPCLMEFLATLSRMQALTVLHLERTLPSASDFLSSGAFRVSPKVHLPRLACLSVTEPLSTVAALLSCMSISLETQLMLEIESENGSSIDDYAQIPAALAQSFSQSKDLPSSHPTIRSLAICSRGYQSTFTIGASELDDYDPKLSVGYLPRDCSAPLMIVVGKEQSIATGWDHLMSDICCCIPLTHVRTLHVVDPPFSPDFWRKTLGHLHGLRRIKLSDGIMPNLASLLALAAGEPAEAPGGDITYDHDPTLGHTFVPALEELELYCIKFGSEDDLSRNVVSKKALLDALSTRKALPPQLTMTQCDYEDDESDMDEY